MRNTYECCGGNDETPTDHCLDCATYGVPDGMDRVYILTWRYSDGSAHGVIRAYRRFDDARRDEVLLRENSDGSRQFEIAASPLIDG